MLQCNVKLVIAEVWLCLFGRRNFGPWAAKSIVLGMFKDLC